VIYIAVNKKVIEKVNKREEGVNKGCVIGIQDRHVQGLEICLFKHEHL